MRDKSKPSGKEGKSDRGDSSRAPRKRSSATAGRKTLERPSGSDGRKRPERSGPAGRPDRGDKKPYAAKKSFSKPDRSFGASDQKRGRGKSDDKERGSGFKKPYGKPAGFKSDRGSDSRPPRNFREKPTDDFKGDGFNEESGKSRPERPERPYSDRKPGGTPFKKPYGSRDESRAPRAPREESKRLYGRKEEGERSERPSAEDDSKPYERRTDVERAVRTPREEGTRSYGRKDDGERSERAPREEGKRPYGRKDDGDRSLRPPREEGKRPYGRKDDADRSSRPPREEGKRPYGRKDDGDRSSRPPREEGKRPYGRKDDGEGASRPPREEGSRPYAPKKDFGDKKDRGERKPFGEKRDFDARPSKSSRDFSETDKPERGESAEGKDENGLIRLNRYISNAGICSRRDADDLIIAGEIKVNGKPVTELGFKVKPGDTVKYGNKILNREKMVYLLLNKPKDFITTTDDPDERKTVMDLIRNACPERIYPVGRLDRNTTGLLLFTNDGELAEKLTHPSYKIQKVYQVDIDKPLADEDYHKIMEGVHLEDGLAIVDELGIVTPDRRSLGLSIHIGKNRIVRRIFEHLGYNVDRLDRVIYAGLTKKDLPRGNYRILSDKEIIKLKHFV